MTSARWISKANSLWEAWISATNSAPPNYNAVRMVLAQAQHETSCGDDWDSSHNWGACDLRALNLSEKAAFKNGDLKVGQWLYPDGSWGPEHRQDSTGTIRGDSDPNSGAFHVWFFAAPTDAEGAAYMLRAGVRGARNVLTDPQCDVGTYAKALYMQCYFGGFHAGARPCGRRPEPMNAAEQANINDYAGAMSKILPSIDAGLASWTLPGQYTQVPEATIAGNNVAANAGDDIGQASTSEPSDPDTK